MTGEDVTASGPSSGPPVRRSSRPLPGWLAALLVGGTSAAVLVVEILAGRLLAPYVGVSLETYTGIIGTVLIGIAAGAASGGMLADRFDPRRLLPLLLVAGGGLTIASVPVVRTLGSTGTSGGGVRILVLAAFGVLPAATVLSAVPPAVVKLQLRDLAATGTTVGRLSAISTGGAIVATFVTGFVLVAWAAVTTLIVATGVVLIAGGLVLAVLGGGRSWRWMSGPGALALLALVGVVTVRSPCQFHTRYYCVAIVSDGDRPDGRTLILDDLRHSYVRLEDPTHLEFWYVRTLAAAIDRYAPAGPLDAAYVGGGALTLPRYVRATRPGSDQVVFEIDADLVGLVERFFGLVVDDRLRVEVGDGRLGVAGLGEDSIDVLIGDAFGSRAAPWHLATEQFLLDVHRVLRPGGLYLANIIDEASVRFLRAETATLAEVFAHVVVVTSPQLRAGGLGNAVVVASDRDLDPMALRAALSAAGTDAEVVDDVAAFAASSPILTDDFAPVDQLLSRRA